jgi:hypothetical protein
MVPTTSTGRTFLEVPGTGGSLYLYSGSASNGANGASYAGNVTIDSGTGTNGNGTVYIGNNNASAITIGRTGSTNTVNGGLTVSTGSTFTNASSTLFSAVAIANLSSGGVIGTAGTTVDVATTFNVNQTTASQTLSLPNPTVTTAGRVVYVNNVGTASFTMHGVSIASGVYSSFVWNGSAWIGEAAAVATSGGTVASIGTINSQTKSANGAVIASNQLIMQTADATNPGLVSIGTQTFAGDKTLQSSSNTAFTIQDTNTNALLIADTNNATLTVGKAIPLTTIATKVDYTTGAMPRGAISADFNRDGKPDIAVGNNNGTSISVFLNNGNGTFAAKADYTANTNTSQLVAADFNGDGWPDIAGTVIGSTTMSVFLNNGNGTFAAKVDYTTNLYSNGIAAGDLNGDGKIDIAVACATNNIVSVFQNNGQGTFAAKNDITTGTGPNGVVLADINRDGRLDMVTTNTYTTTISYLRNRGLATISSGTPFDTKVDYSNGTAPTFLVAGDFNNDNFTDIATTNGSAGTVSIYLNNGSGGLGAATTVSVGSSPVGITTSDINGDGDLDLLIANSGSASLSVLANNGSGTFSSLATPATATTPYGVTSADFNNDGISDIAVTNAGSDTLSVLINNSKALTVTGNLSASSLNIADNGALLVEGVSTFKNLTNSQNAFQIQNATGSNIINVDTSNLDLTPNLITNGDFETSTTGWAIKNSSTSLATSTTQTFSNFSSLSWVVSQPLLVAACLIMLLLPLTPRTH